MPNIKSAWKRMRQTRKLRATNRAVRSETRTARRRFNEVVASGDQAESAGNLKELYSLLDKAVKKGVLKANTVSRYKSRAAKKVDKKSVKPAAA